MSQIDRIAVLTYYCFVIVYHLLLQFVLKTGAGAQGGNFTVRRTVRARNPAPQG